MKTHFCRACGSTNIQRVTQWDADRNEWAPSETPPWCATCRSAKGSDGDHRFDTYPRGPSIALPDGTTWELEYVGRIDNIGGTVYVGVIQRDAAGEASSRIGTHLPIPHVATALNRSEYGMRLGEQGAFNIGVSARHNGKALDTNPFEQSYGWPNPLRAVQWYNGWRWADENPFRPY